MHNGIGTRTAHKRPNEQKYLNILEYFEYIGVVFKMQLNT